MQVDSTGVFEVQLTSLINGWGLTHDGLCCSPHNHIRNAITNADNTFTDDDHHHSDGGVNNADHSGNTRVDRDTNGSYLQEDEDDEDEEEEEDWGCREECRTFLRVCLSHLQDPLPTSQTLTLAYMCTFGSAVSPVLGGNTLDPFGTWEERALSGRSVDPDTLVRIPFTFSWPVSINSLGL